MKEYIPMMIFRKPEIEEKNSGRSYPLELPKGCTGIVYAFKSKKAAYEFYGTKNIKFLAVKIEEPE